ncbi:MAG TPA: transposase [Candidatus Acidoferrum sp.]|nr:transposase [Candidatus Acidoferrum sp.]
MQFRRKRIRLPESRYLGRQIYLVTLCSEKRHPVFAKEAVGHWLATRLLGMATRERFIIHAYCIMPDHLHVLLEGSQETCDLIRFVLV